MTLPASTSGACRSLRCVLVAALLVGAAADVVASLVDARPGLPGTTLPFVAPGEIAAGDLAVSVHDGAVIALEEDRIWVRALGVAPSVRVAWRGSGAASRRVRVHLENLNLVAAVVSVSPGATVVSREGGTLEVERALGEGPLEVSAAIPADTLARGKVAVLGCTRSNHLLARIVSELERERPLFVVHMGDLGHGLAYEMEAFREAFDAIALPVFVSPGNHDVSQWRRGSLAPFHQAFGPSPSAFEAAGRRFVLLDVSSYPLRPAQLAWLGVAVGGEAPPSWLFLHRSPIDTRGRELPASVSAPVAAAVRSGAVAATFASHLGGLERGCFGGRPCTMSSGGGEAGAELYHHLLVALDGSGEQVVTYERPGWVDGLASRARIELPILLGHTRLGVAAALLALVAGRLRMSRVRSRARSESERPRGVLLDSGA